MPPGRCVVLLGKFVGLEKSLGFILGIFLFDPSQYLYLGNYTPKLFSLPRLKGTQIARLDFHSCAARFQEEWWVATPFCEDVPSSLQLGVHLSLHRPHSLRGVCRN